MRWRPAGNGRRHRLGANDAEHPVCNCAVPDDDDATLCRSCRLKQVLRNLQRPGKLRQ